MSHSQADTLGKGLVHVHRWAFSCENALGELKAQKENLFHEEAPRNLDRWQNLGQPRSH